MAGMHSQRCSLKGQTLSFISWRSCNCVRKGRTTVTSTASKNGFFRSVLNAFVEARQAEAERYVNRVLLSLDDETLKAHGYNRAELSKRGTSNRFWF